MSASEQQQHPGALPQSLPGKPSSSAGAATAGAGPSFPGEQRRMTYVSMSQDHTCFVIGTTLGFCVYTCDPLTERFKREWGKGVGIVELLENSNILAIVGGGPNPKWPRNKLIIWDDYQNRPVAEMEFSKPVKGVKIRRDLIVAILEDQIHIHKFNDLSNLITISTLPNPGGLGCLGGKGPVAIFGCLGTKAGTALVVEVDKAKGTCTSSVLSAHKTPISWVSISQDGSLLATVSEKGTLIRIFDVEQLKLLREYRRGTKQSDICSLTFSADNSYILVTASSGTTHLFDLTTTDQQSKERSIIRLHSDFEKSVSYFGHDQTSIIVISYDGRCCRYNCTFGKGLKASYSKEIVEFDLFKITSATPTTSNPPSSSSVVITLN